MLIFPSRRDNRSRSWAAADQARAPSSNCSFASSSRKAAPSPTMELHSTWRRPTQYVRRQAAFSRKATCFAGQSRRISPSAWMFPWRTSYPQRSARRSTTPFWDCPRAMTPWSMISAALYPAASGSVSPSRALLSVILLFFCSTNPPPCSTRSRRQRSTTP